MCIYSDRNQIARLVNSACTLPTAALTPLVNSKTGDHIAQFPVNVAVINAMACECSVILPYLSFSICMISAPEVNSLLTAGGWWKLDGMILYGLVACGTGMDNFFSFLSF